MASACSEATKVAAAEGTWRGETQIVDRAGETRTMSQIVIAHRDADGSLSHFSTILHDVSDMRRAEERLLDRRTSSRCRRRNCDSRPTPRR